MLVLLESGAPYGLLHEQYPRAQMILVQKSTAFSSTAPIENLDDAIEEYMLKLNVEYREFKRVLPVFDPAIPHLKQPNAAQTVGKYLFEEDAKVDPIVALGVQSPNTTFSCYQSFHDGGMTIAMLIGLVKADINTAEFLFDIDAFEPV